MFSLSILHLNEGFTVGRRSGLEDQEAVGTAPADAVPPCGWLRPRVPFPRSLQHFAVPFDRRFEEGPRFGPTFTIDQHPGQGGLEDRQRRLRAEAGVQDQRGQNVLRALSHRGYAATYSSTDGRSPSRQRRTNSSTSSSNEAGRGVGSVIRTLLPHRLSARHVAGKKREQVLEPLESANMPFAGGILGNAEHVRGLVVA